MATSTTDAEFFVWGIDRTAYGPVELPTLVSWVKDERVTAETWIFVGKDGVWRRATEINELQMFFRSKGDGAKGLATLAEVDPRTLRRVKILGGMNDEQLGRFAQYMQVEKVPQWTVIVKQGEVGDTMYLILQGELRVRMNVKGKETILAT